MNPCSAETSPFAIWDAFAARHAGHAHLALDPLYSLSEALIDAICVELPAFFSVEDERLERDLARTASFGFFRRIPYGRGAEPAGATSGRSLLEGKQETAVQINEMLAAELRRSGADNEDIREHFDSHEKQCERSELRRSAYTGWLILNPEFRAALRLLREQWAGVGVPAGQFPRWSIWPHPAQCANAWPAGFQDACFDFYARWSLDTLLTWDWPVPMTEDLNTALRSYDDRLVTAGAILFLPWYLLRGEQLDLQQVVRAVRLASAPGHLLDWVNKREQQKGKDFGDQRYATIRWLYRYSELALKPRYAAAWTSNQQRLDRAFAKASGELGEDSIKKLRLRLARATAEVEIVSDVASGPETTSD